MFLVDAAGVARPDPEAQQTLAGATGAAHAEVEAKKVGCPTQHRQRECEQPIACVMLPAARSMLLHKALSCSLRWKFRKGYYCLWQLHTLAVHVSSSAVFNGHKGKGYF